jgi:hypothetical protein
MSALKTLKLLVLTAIIPGLIGCGRTKIGGLADDGSINPDFGIPDRAMPDFGLDRFPPPLDFRTPDRFPPPLDFRADRFPPPPRDFRADPLSTAERRLRAALRWVRAT